MSHVALQDYETYNLNEWTQIMKPDLFHVIKQPVLPLEGSKDSWVRVTFEMDLNRLDYSRSRYTLLDLLAAFGGFMGIFRWIFSTYMAAWNTNALDNFMVSKLYKVQRANLSFVKKGQNATFLLPRSRFPHLCDYLMSWVPSISQCCHLSKDSKAKAQAKARAILNKEMNMVKLLQQ